MLTATPRRRAERRIPARMFVRLWVPETGKFEMAQTLDISSHGARLVCRNFWTPNQYLQVRLLRANFTAFARVAHCEYLADKSYAVGLQLYDPTGDWTTFAQPASSHA